jgi:hypothetical protein
MHQGTSSKRSNLLVVKMSSKKKMVAILQRRSYQ